MLFSLFTHERTDTGPQLAYLMLGANLAPSIFLLRSTKNYSNVLPIKTPTIPPIILIMATTSDDKATVEAASTLGTATDLTPHKTAAGMTAIEADATATQPSNSIVDVHNDAATNKTTAKPQPEAELGLKDQISGSPVADLVDSSVEQGADESKQQTSGEEASQPAADGEDDAMDIDETPPTAPAPKSKGKGKARLQVVAVGEVAFDSPITKKEMLAFLDQHSIEAYPVKQTWIQIARKLLQDQSDLPLSKAQMLARLDKYAINATKETLVYIEVARRLITSLKDNSAPDGKANGGEPTPKRKREAEVTQESQAGEVKRQKSKTEESKGDPKEIEKEPTVSQGKVEKGTQTNDDKETQFRQASTWTSSDGRMNMQSGFP